MKNLLENKEILAKIIVESIKNIKKIIESRQTQTFDLVNYNDEPFSVTAVIDTDGGDIEVSFIELVDGSYDKAFESEIVDYVENYEQEIIDKIIAIVQQENEWQHDSFVEYDPEVNM